MEQAIAIYRAEGSEAVSSFLAQAGESLDGKYHLIDIAGKDLATGEDLSEVARLFSGEKRKVFNYR